MMREGGGTCLYLIQSRTDERREDLCIIQECEKAEWSGFHKQHQPAYY